MRRDARAPAAGGGVSVPGGRAGGSSDAVAGMIPRWVVVPETVDAVQAIVRDAAERGWAVVASGLGARLDLGAPPARLDVLVRLDRLAAVVDHQAADMTVTVEAGCPLDRLDAVLARAGQWLPLDPPLPERTTIGGAIAADVSGPLRASQGRVRDLLLGIRVVAADGALVSGGGRVVKNVAGYDLPKLHVGALGTLGIVVEATFKVRPRPAREEAVVIAARTAEAATDTAQAILDSDVAPHWLEVAGAGGLAEGPGDGAAVAVGIAGIEAEVTHGRDRVIALAVARGLPAIAVADGGGLRARLGGFPIEPAAAVLRAATLPSDVARVITDAQSQAAVRCLAHAANGVVHIAVAREAEVVPLIRALRPGLEGRGGSLVVARSSPALASEIDVWGDAGPGLPLMRGVKAAFDPAGIFAPGRFVGGL